MNAASRVLLFTGAGLLAGLFTWSLIDLFRLIPISDRIRALTPADIRHYQLAGMAWGASLGVFLGLADTLAQGTRAQWLRVIGLGLLVGMIAGVIGLTLGMAAFGPLYTEGAHNPLAFIGNVVARGLGWAFIGALAGTVDGWRKLSPRVGRNGFIGGLIGGVLGGTTFEVVPYLMPGLNAGPTARLLGFAITGAMIGLMISLVQELFKEAWIRVVVGRNEGREYLIEKAETKIGRAELSDIPLFGDSNIARTHAILLAGPSGWTLRDTGESPSGTRVNDERIAGERPLRSGDRVQIGGKLLVFYEKQVREFTAPARKDVRKPAPSFVPPLPAPERRGEARLLVIAGLRSGQTIPLPAGEEMWTIGRDPGADIALPEDEKASRSHARIWRDAAGVTLEDGGSTNGTFVNGQRITRMTLASGDTILIGTTTLRFE